VKELTLDHLVLVQLNTLPAMSVAMMCFRTTQVSVGTRPLRSEKVLQAVQVLVLMKILRALLVVRLLDELGPTREQVPHVCLIGRVSTFK